MIAATVLVEVLGLRSGLDNTHGVLELIMFGWFEFLFGDISIFFIMILTIERWFAVVKPIQYRYKFRKIRVYIYIMTIIIAALSTNTYLLLPGNDPTSPRFKSLSVIDVALSLIVPLFFHLGYVYSSMAAFQKGSNHSAIE